ncbi:hypothetical protein F5144DRAFT_575675 [Chaetomium tenue]|uniref:Uncharacterized protein n=1 Tax=Chaetomium tenue TaxID=1854479 RepID=A0ACB7P0V3_9PEZI|nr:hypothetical protein F5144DRAFT_575675 [Chaetomium globosum]
MSHSQPSPSAVFASLPELVRCLAEQICSTREFTTLCLVNKTFNAAITPVLYRQLTISGSTGHGAVSLQLALASTKKYDHVRELLVRGSGNRGSSDFQSLVSQLLPSLSRLRTFTWRGGSNPLPVAVLSALHKSSPAIKAIHIDFPNDMGQRLGYSDFPPPPDVQLEQRRLYERPDLTVFSCLEELTLNNLHEELPWWRAQVAQVLRNSPRLRALELSLADQTLEHYNKRNEREKFEGFFDQLCDDYGKTGAVPLRLRSLHLGNAVYPYSLDSLQRLTDLHFLERVHIENVGVWHGGVIISMYDDGDDSGIIFDAFGPAHCPNLRDLSVAGYRKDVHRFLAALDPPSARRLAILCPDMTTGYEPAALLRPNPIYPSLPLHVRMLEMELRRNQIRLFDNDGRLLNHDEIPSAKQVLEDLVSGDDGTLEGLAVHLTESPGPKIGFDELDLLTNALQKLDNLTQLAVNINDEKRVKREAANKVVRVLATAPPRLRYIRLYSWYWRVWRAAGDTKVRLEELDISEVEHVELLQGLPTWEPGSF